MDRLLQRNIVDEINESFLTYSMSVIVARALPDLRDGLNGEEMSFDNRPNNLPENVFIVSKKYLKVKENGQYSFRLLNKYINEMVDNSEKHPDIEFLATKLYNFEVSYPLLLPNSKKLCFLLDK